MGASSRLMKEQNLRMGGDILQSGERSTLDKAKVREICRILRKVANKDRLADVGCFDGTLSMEFFKCGFSTIDGFDVLDSALERARKRGVNAFKWNFEEEPSPAESESYDAIICSDTMEHVFNNQNLVSECRRIMKPSGLAVFVVPNLASLYNRLLVLAGKMPLGSPGVSVSQKTENRVNLGHARLGTLKEWAGFLTVCGFEIEDVIGLWSTRFSKAITFTRPSLAHSLVYGCRKV